MKKSTLRPLAAAVGLLIASTSYAQEFSQMIIFGDSLTDTGRFKSLNPALASQNSFTTNPDTTWAGHLASFYGATADPYTTANPNGTNYAVGGATSATDNPIRLLGIPIATIPSVKTQIDSYLSANSTDPNALYAVWIGANDLLGAEGKSTAEAAAIISTAATDTATQINRLQDAGAKYILVPNLPDVGLTQKYVNNATGAATATQGAMLYNNTLFSALNNSNANIIPANTFALLQETIANYQDFGFKVSNTQIACTNFSLSSVSVNCGQNNWRTSTANEDYVFADEIHPSGRTHRILAQYYRSLIDSPTQMASVVGRLTQSGSTNHTSLYRRLNSLDGGTHSVWVDGYVSNIELNNGDKLDKPSVTVGFDFAGQNSHTGLYLNHHKQSHTLSSTITADSKQIGVGLYHQHNFGNLRINADLGVDKIDLDTQRNIDWEGATRVHHGDANGRRYHAGVELGYGFDINQLTVRPYVGLNAQKVRIRDFTEDNPNLSTALQYSLPTQKSLQNTVGLDLEYQFTPALGLHAGIGHSKEHKDNDDAVVGAKLPSIKEYHRNYEMPVSYQNSDSTYAHLGAKVGMGRANVTFGATANRLDGNTDYGGYVGLQAKF